MSAKVKKTPHNTNCCVYNCHSRKEKDRSIHFHHFPKRNASEVKITNADGGEETMDRRKAWEKVLLMGNGIFGKPVTTTMRVCSLHFQEKDYIAVAADSDGNVPVSPKVSKSYSNKSNNHWNNVNEVQKPFSLFASSLGNSFTQYSSPLHYTTGTGLHSGSSSPIIHTNRTENRTNKSCKAISQLHVLSRLDEGGEEEECNCGARQEAVSEDQLKDFDSNLFGKIDKSAAEQAGNSILPTEAGNRSLLLRAKRASRRSLEALARSWNDLFTAESRLEPYEAEMASLLCNQCSHRAVWQFQLDHHVRRNHENVNAADLMNASAELELYPSIGCDFNTYYKLVRYKHHKSQRLLSRVESKHLERYLLKTYSCNNCQYKGHSSLSLVKHHDSCEGLPKAPKIKTENDIVIVMSHDLTLNADFECTRYPFKDQVRRRMVTHVRGDKIFKCAKCPYHTKHKSHFRRHIMTHASAADVNSFSCPECHFKSKYKASLSRHMVTHASADDVLWFSCVKCSYRTKQKATLTRHMRNCQHKEQSSLSLVEHHDSCEMLPEAPKIKSENDIDIAMSHHLTLNSDFECTQYPDQVKSVRRRMVTHVRGDKMFTCEKCPYHTKHKSHLTRHMVTHASDADGNSFSCSECHFKTKHEASLSRHMVTHASTDDVRWFSCVECSYRTKQKGTLSRHMLTHVSLDDVDSFSCTECSFRTKHRKSLNRHMVTHVRPEEINWFQCSQCSYRSKLLEGLTKHYKLKRTAKKHMLNNLLKHGQSS